MRWLRRPMVFFLIPVILTLVICAVLAGPAPSDRKSPGPPIGLSLTACTETTVSLAWGPAAEDQAVSRYLVYEYGVAVQVVDIASCTLTGLRPGTRYIFTVKARDAAGRLSAASEKLTVITPGMRTPAGPPPAKMVVAYYASWRAYQGYTPANLDGGKLTALNYAFADIDKNLSLIVSDPAVDPGNFQELAALKQAFPHLLTFITVGGWDGSGRFSNVALTEASRAAFAESCVQFMLKYGFDGLDIDWEYPVVGGKSGNARRAEDKNNFTLLLAKLREVLDRQGTLDGKRYYLTIAAAATPGYVRNYTEMGLLHQYVDWINVMTYDLHGAWDRCTDFGAALYCNGDISGQDKLFTADSLRYFLEAGVPPVKIVMGVPFYGRIYAGVAAANNGLYQRFKTCATITAVEAASVYRHAPGYNRYWHPESMAPWLFDGSTFIDCDDTESLEKKANHVREQDLGGVMIWEISLDPNQVLLDALLKGLSQSP